LFHNSSKLIAKEKALITNKSLHLQEESHSEITYQLLLIIILKVINLHNSKKYSPAIS